jgi:hypothetical protein
MAKKKAEVALLGQHDIPGFLDTVKKQIASIKGDLPNTPKTTGELPGFGKIENIDKVETLIKAASSVLGREKAYYEAAEEIMPRNTEGKNLIKVPEFKLEGSTKDAWIDHIKSRMIIVANKTKLEKLEKIKRKLEENLSAEAKLANDLKEIQGIIDEENE